MNKNDTETIKPTYPRCFVRFDNKWEEVNLTSALEIRLATANKGWQLSSQSNELCLRELHKVRDELAAEREKVRVLREALEKYQHTLIAGGTNPARAALAATEVKP
jgi:hypothetical protein